MDNYNYQQPNDNSYQNNTDKRSAGLATAALVLGIVSLVTIFSIVTPYVCGSLAIILGLLSKGGETTVDGRGKAGIITGTIALCIITLILFIFGVFGSENNAVNTFEREFRMEFENEYNNYNDYYNNDYDDYDYTL